MSVQKNLANAALKLDGFERNESCSFDLPFDLIVCLRALRVLRVQLLSDAHSPRFASVIANIGPNAARTSLR